MDEMDGWNGRNGPTYKTENCVIPFPSSLPRRYALMYSMALVLDHPGTLAIGRTARKIKKWL